MSHSTARQYPAAPVPATSRMPAGDDLGDRMKAYEAVETGRRFDPAKPILARIDGRGFSRFTRGFKKPFDPDLSRAMRETCSFLVETSHARIGYVQSDEISLVFLARNAAEGRNADGRASSVFFDGRAQKLVSVLAATATMQFARSLMSTHAELVLERMPVFDARVWQVPSREEAASALLWRAQDARRNGISAAARAHFSHRSLQGRGQAAMLAMMAEAGIDFETAYDPADRLGVFFRRETQEALIKEAVWERIPEHRRPESRTVLRSAVVALPPRYFGDVVNRTEFVFEDTVPALGLKGRSGRNHDCQA